MLPSDSDSAEVAAVHVLHAALDGVTVSCTFAMISLFQAVQAALRQQCHLQLTCKRAMPLTCHVSLPHQRGTAHQKLL